MKRLKAKWVRRPSAERLYQRPYPIVALTGGIASGKSTVAEFLKKQGVPIVSADQLIKDIYGWPATKSWLKTLRPDVVGEDGIDFPKLRALAFSETALKAELESYLYQRLPAAFVQREKQYPVIPWLVYEVPLLYERDMAHLFDAVIVCWVRSDVQKTRLLKRDPTTTPELADAILKSQLPLDEKRLKADLVFDNSEVLDPAALQKLWDELVD